MKRSVGLSRLPVSWRLKPGWCSSTLSPAGLIYSSGDSAVAFGTFIAHASFYTVRLTSPAEALWYARALPAAIQARPHWQAAITAAQNAERSPSQIGKAADALKADSGQRRRTCRGCVKMRKTFSGSPSPARRHRLGNL